MTNPLFPPPEETEEIGSALARLIRSQLERSGLGEALNEILTWVILCAFILILASLAYFIARVIVTRSVRYVAKRSTTQKNVLLRREGLLELTGEGRRMAREAIVN